MGLQSHCINGSNETIDNLVKQTGLPLEIVKAEIGVWRTLNNSTEGYPDTSWIKRRTETPKMQHFNKNRDEYYYGEEMTPEKEAVAFSKINFDNLSQAANKFFPSDPNELIDYIKSLVSEDTYLDQLLDYLIDGYFKLGINPIVKYDDNLDDIARIGYNGIDTVLEVNRTRFLASLLIEPSRPIGSKAKQILSHELIHPLTRDAVAFSKETLNFLQARKEDIQFNEKITELYNIAVEKINGDFYGLRNKREFVSELMTNPDFQKELSKIPYEESRSIFHRFVQLLKDLFVSIFDIDISNTLLEESLQVAHEYTNFAIINGRFSFFDSATFDLFKDMELQAEFRKPPLPSGMTVKESPQSRIYREFGTRLDDRINMVARDFQNTLDKLRVRKMKQLKKQLSDQNQGTYKLDDIDDILMVKEQIDMLQENRFEDRGRIIELIGTENVISEIMSQYDNYRKNGKPLVENQEYAKQEYDKIYNNFQALFNEASVLLLKFNGLDVTIEENESDDDGFDAASGNEGWGIKMHLINLKDITSGKTKRILYSIPMYKSDGKSFEHDDLGNVKYMDGEQVRKTLVEIVSQATSPEDFCVYDRQIDEYTAFPVLDNALKKYKWIQPIITYLKRNPEYVDAFYSDMMNDFYQYKTVKDVKQRDSDAMIRTSVNLNERSNTEAQLDLIKSTINEGRVLNKNLSIYDDNGLIAVGNIPALEKQITSLKPYIDSIKDGSTVTKEFAKELLKVLNSIGYPVSIDELIESLRDIDNPGETLTNLYSTIKQLVLNIKKNKADNYLLFKDNQNFYKTIIQLCGLIDGLAVTLTFRLNGNQYTSYSKPNFVSMQLKLLKNDPELFLNFYRKDSCFTDEHGDFYFDILNVFRDDVLAREKFGMFYSNQLNNTDYREWTPELIYRSFIDFYFNGNPEGYGGINSPILADTPVAMFFTMPKYQDDLDEDFEQKLLPKFRLIVKFEMKRIKRTNEQTELGTKIISNYSKRGKLFNFFPELNNLHVNEILTLTQDAQGNVTFRNKYDSTDLFLKHYNDLLDAGRMDEADKLIEDAVEYIMQGYFNEFSINVAPYLDGIKKDLVDNKIIKDNEDERRKLKEFFWNNTFSEMNIIHLFGMDPAYSKNGTDFQKRWKQIYASGWKANTAGKYGKKTQNVIYLSDEEFRSKVYDDIRFVCDKLILEKKITSIDRENILRIFNKVNNSDAQAMRSVKSFKQIMQMLGKWYEVRDSVDNLMKGTWDYSDFNKIYQTIKPFMYCVVEEDDGLGGKQLVPHHNKNSEFLLMAVFDVMSADLHKSEKLKGLSRFMEESGIDVVMYESAVKLGCSNPIDLNYSRSKVEKALSDGFITIDGQDYHFNPKSLQEGSNDFLRIMHTYEKMLEDNQGSLTLDIVNKIYDALLMNEQEVYDLLVEQTGRKSGSNGGYTFDYNIVHQQPLDFWSVIQPTPAHFFDSLSVEGSQERNITPADLPDDFTTVVNGVKMNKQQYLDAYFGTYVEDFLRSLFGESDESGNNVGGFMDLFVDKDGNFDIEKFVQKIQKQIQGNDKYGRQIKEAIQLITENGTKKTRLSFTSPLMYQLQELVFSMAKNQIVKRKTTGGAVILAADMGLTDELKVVYEYTDGSGRTIDLQQAKKLGINMANVKLAYVECYMPFHMQEAYKNYLTTGHRKAFVDGKYINEEFVTLDIAKIQRDCPDALKALGMRIPTENKYSITPLMIKGFLPKQNGSSIMVASDITALTGCDFDVDKMFLYFKEIRFGKDGKLHSVGYQRPNKGLSVADMIPNLNKAQRTNLKFDLKWTAMTSTQTLASFQNPGNFEQLKKYSRISYLLQNRDLLEEFWKLHKGDEFEVLFGSNLSVFDDFLKEHGHERNIATLDTFVYNHIQNMTGGNLIGVYAVGGSQHLKYQNADINLIRPISINGKLLQHLDDLYNQDGWNETKLLAEFLAASVDNVKDPVLANMLQNISTANIAIWMVRMGFNMEEITLVFNNPMLVNLFKSTGNFNKLGDIVDDMIDRVADDRARKMYKEPIKDMTSEMLYKAIVNYSWFNDSNLHTPDEITSDIDITLKTLVYINNLINLSKPISAVTKISKYDSPKNAPSTIASSMKNYLDVDAFSQKLKDYLKIYTNLNKATSNTFINEDEDVDELNIDALRRKIMQSKIPMTQAAYTIGYQIPMMLISKHVFTLNNDKVRKQVRNLSRILNLSEDLLGEFYERYTHYNLTRTQLFGDDEEMSFAEKYKYYTQVFPSAFIKIKNENPEIANIPIIKMMAVENNRIILRKSGRLSKDETNVLTRNLDDMLFSENPIKQKLAVDLFMYSFYKEKCSVDHSSFNQLFSVQFIECFPEYNKQCEMFDSMCEDDSFMFGFEKLFVYNNADVAFREVKPHLIGRPTGDDGIMYLKQDSFEYIKIGSGNNDNSGLRIDFYNEQQQEQNTDEYRYYARIDQGKYLDITNQVRMFKSNDLYYAGSMDLDQVVGILKNPYKGTDVTEEDIQHSEQIEQSVDNTDTESTSLVDMNIQYPTSDVTDIDMPTPVTETEVEIPDQRYDIEESMRQQDQPMCINETTKTI